MRASGKVQMKAVVYARMACADEDAEVWLNKQVGRCQEYAEAKGYVVVQVYTDLGHSGATADRPGLRQMMAELAQPNARVERVALCERIFDVKNRRDNQQYPQGVMTSKDY